MKLSAYIGWRFLRSKREHRMLGLLAWVSLGGVMLGVAALVVSTTVLESFRHQLLESTFGINGHAWVKSQAPFSLTEAEVLSRRLNELDEVRSAEPYVLREAFLQRKSGGFQAVQLRGLQAVQFRELQLEQQGQALAEAGKSKELAASDSGSVLLSVPLAQQLELGRGDSLRLISTTTRVSPLGPLPFIKQFSFAGVIDTGTEEELAVISLQDARMLYGLGERVDGVALQLEEPLEVDLKPLKFIALGYQVSSWADVHKALFQVMKLERLGLWLVLSLIVLVSLVNISASLAMMVQEKRGALAVLTTLGGSQSLVGGVFVRQGIWIGLVGSMGGLALGMLFSAGFVAWTNAYLRESFSELSLSWDWWSMAGLATAVMALSILTGVWTARQAMHTQPADVLREY